MVRFDVKAAERAKASRRTRKDAGVPRRTPQQIEAFRRVAESGGSIREAALAAGYAPSVAAKGRCDLPSVLEEMLPKIKEHIALGQKLNPQEQEAYVRGRALALAENGSDKGAQVLKLLGSDRRVNMFVPDTQIGVIVVGESARLDALDESITIPADPADNAPSENE